MKISTPYGRKKCPYCKRYVGIARNPSDKTKFKLQTHGLGFFRCEGSGMEVKPK